MKYFLLQFGPRLSWVYTYFHAVTKRIITLHKNKIVFFIKEYNLISIVGSKRPESNFVYRQHWFIIWNWLQTLCIDEYHLNEWYKPIKIIESNSHVEV